MIAQRSFKYCVFCTLFLFFLIVCVPIFAQSKQCNYRLSGHIYSADSQEGLPSASIFIEEANKRTLADSHGHFQYENLCKGRYVIRVSFLGYESQKLQIQLDTSLFLKIRLEENSILLEAITIQAASLADVQVGQPATQLSEIEISQTQGKNLGEMLKTITGVNSLQTGNSISKPVIHGLHSNRILILNHGVRQEGQQWGSEHAPEVDPFVAQNISVVKGAAGVRYGSDAIGGVIILSPKSLPSEKGMAGEVNLIGISNGRQGTFSGILEGNTKKKQEVSGVAWRIQGTLKRSGNIRTPNYYLANTGLKEINFSAALGYQKYHGGVEAFFSRFSTQIGIFSGAHIGNLTDLRRVIESGEPFIKSDFSYQIDRPFQDVSHNLLKINAFLKFDNWGKITTTYALQVNLRKEYDAHRPLNDSLLRLNKPELNFQLNTHTLDLIFEHKPLLGAITGSIGASGTRQTNIYQGRPLVPNFRSYNGGIFWIERLTKSKYELELGFRYDYKWLKTFERLQNGSVGSIERIFNNFSTTIGANYKINKNIEWHTNFATAWRPPNINELFSNGVHHGAASFEKGDENLTPEVAYNLSTTFNYAHPKLTFEMVLYYNHINNYIYLKPQFPEVLTIRGAFPSFAYTQTDAIFRGIDTKIVVPLSSAVSWEAKGSFLWAYNRRDDAYLVLIPANRVENEVSYKIDSWRKMKNIIFSVSYLSVFEQKRVPIASDYATPPKSYGLANLDISTSLSVGKKDKIGKKENVPMQIGLQVNNVFNTVYRDYMNRFRYFSDEIGRNISLRIKMSF
ncbi:MAG: TonB-dependent receptor [Cytophagales bacterium]|nr:MAG: TonB-dependent receptor [Cytophagales bacterium]